MEGKITRMLATLMVAALMALLAACGGGDANVSALPAANSAPDATIPETTVPERTVPDNFGDPNPDTPETAVLEDEVPETAKLGWIEEAMEEAEKDRENATTRDEYMEAGERYQELNSERAAYLSGFRDGQG